MGNKTTSKYRSNRVNLTSVLNLVQLLSYHEHRLKLFKLTTGSINPTSTICCLTIRALITPDSTFDVIQSITVKMSTIRCLNLDFLVVSYFLKETKPKFDISNSANEPLGFAMEPLLLRDHFESHNTLE